MADRDRNILSLNAGSSSLKFGLFQPEPDGSVSAKWRGLIEGIGTAPHFVAKDGSGKTVEDRPWDTAHGAHAEVLGDLVGWVEDRLGGAGLSAVGHRIVHGGRDFSAPVRLTPEVVEALEKLTPLAPLHQPRSLEPVRALAELRPGLCQIGCFDTAFHHGLEPPVSRFAIPRALEEEGVRRYGFHGLSYEFIAGRLVEISPELAGRRTVVAHLGNGASLCAMQDGRSVDTTMGFSALDGLVMGTRPGSIDPGVLLYLQRAKGMSIGAVEHLLYHESGLLGVSGISSDMRVLLESRDPRAVEAVDLFTFAIARETAAMANTLGGLDVLVFTAGIGEHSPEIRAGVGARLAWLGVEIDPAANGSGAVRIAVPKSKVEVLVVPTDEEIVIAQHAVGVLNAG